jgi:DNA mismatch repair protein MutL
MGAIRVLPPEVANQIAAGEVVERPSSVVKELMENALDAGASRIELRLQGGGADLIEVSDNGCGMEADDASLALQRHATSKVSALADLSAVRSFGFRGEALPSIASVSRFVLTTSTGGPGAGVRVRIDGGRLARAEPAAHPRGTTVRVEALFYNAPARRKFLRAPATEAAHIHETVARLAAAHPAISFRVLSSDREQLDWPAGGGLRDRVTQILGASEAEALVPVADGDGLRRVAGLAATPALHRASPRDEHLYVNSRPVRDRRLLHAAHQAYATLLPRGRYPVLFLFLDLPPDEVDVNVHPSKAEVRFRSPGAIHDLVLRALRRSLPSAPRWGPLEVEPADARGPAEAVREPAPSSAWSGADDRIAAPASRAPSEVLSAGPARDGVEAAEPRTEQAPLIPDTIEALGQFRDTYILAAARDGLVLVDQHAAHERVLYERHLADAAAARVDRQRLLFPSILDAPATRLLAFERSRDLLRELGFVIEPFGGASLRVEEVPASIPAAAAEGLIRDLLATLAESDRTDRLQDLRHRIAALSACHAAVRAGEALQPEGMRRIIRDLGRARSPMTCPHGRPTMLHLPLERIEREFRRR